MEFEELPFTFFNFEARSAMAGRQATLLMQLSLTRIIARWPERGGQVLERLRWQRVKGSCAQAKKQSTNRLPEVESNDEALSRYGRVSAKCCSETTIS